MRTSLKSVIDEVNGKSNSVRLETKGVHRREQYTEICATIRCVDRVSHHRFRGTLLITISRFLIQL